MARYAEIGVLACFTLACSSATESSSSTHASGGAASDAAPDVSIDSGGSGGTVIVPPDASSGGSAGFLDCPAAAAARGSIGCDFWALHTDIIPDGNGACFAAIVTNGGTAPLHLSVELDGVALPSSEFTRIPSGQGKSIVYGPYDEASGIPGGEVAIVFLDQDLSLPSQMPKCPIKAAVTTQVKVDGTGLGKAFHLTTDKPAVVYQILPYGSGAAMATSATLLLPTSAWDTNYVAVNAYAKSAIKAEAMPSLNVLAQEDGTEVHVLPIADIAAGNGVVAGPAGKTWSLTLSAGQYVQITQPAELTGSPIQSNKPIGVWGGASCLNVPVDASACDSAQQQLPPIKALGTEYAAVRYRGRGGQNESPPWRLVGAVDATALSYEPSAPAGAPTTLDLGQVAEFSSAGPFVVKSQDAQHPFYLAGYMTGGEDFSGEGDPEFVNAIPVAQYLNDYVFFTDPTYPETNLVIVRKPGKDGSFADVMLDCAGKVGGWQPLGAYQYTRVDLTTGNFVSVGGCGSGRHEISSQHPFGMTVWGWGTESAMFLGQPTSWVSYAYPAGVSVVPINDVVIPVPK